MMNRWGALAATLALVAGPRADAMQIELTRAELCALSTAVVYGTVTDLDTVWAEGAAGGIERRAFLSVERVVRGPRLSGAEIVLPGGTLGKQWTWVEDVPDLKPDATYVLFLGLRGDGSTYEVLGGEAGALRVAPGGLGEGEPLDTIIRSLEACRAK
jgi:hypothetical protein